MGAYLMTRTTMIIGVKPSHFPQGVTQVMRNYMLPANRTSRVISRHFESIDFSWMSAGSCPRCGLVHERYSQFFRDGHCERNAQRPGDVPGSERTVFARLRNDYRYQGACKRYGQ